MVSVPHGGVLVDRQLSSDKAQQWLDHADDLPKLTVSRRQILDLELIAVGAFSPLSGFMTSADYKSVVEHMRLANGLPWSLPITLAVSEETANTLRVGSYVLLQDDEGRPCAVLELQDRYRYDRDREAQKVFRTEDLTHPGVRALYEQGDVLLGGPIWLLGAASGGPFPEFISTPTAARAEFAERGWKTVVGFQTRNPVHRAHEYIQKCAMETIQGLFLHPLVGETKDDDIPSDVRMRCYQALLEHYYPANRVVLGSFPARMRYAGPREAIFHALVRKNYGCTHFIVGRDHAGVGNYYGTYAAQEIFGEFAPSELGITPMFFENAFFCRTCGGMASSKTCPHSSDRHVALSGTRVRAMLSAGENLPAEFSRPEVASLLIAAMQPQFE
ncbi:MAG TPA: sulfate adenylyltransferase [Ktedonobacterales bacterium]